MPYYDYSSAGAYFVTICVKDRSPIFGEINGEQLLLSTAGDIVKIAWFDLPNHYSLIDLDEFIVMPNHVHGIIWILGEPSGSATVGAGLKPAPTKHDLPEIIRGFKTFSARKVNENQTTLGKPLWQRGYHEHIIRNDDDLYQHRSYILNNPLKWAVDEYYQ